TNMLLGLEQAYKKKNRMKIGRFQILFFFLFLYESVPLGDTLVVICLLMTTSTGGSIITTTY
ncbi:hypothetical protein ACJX0J_006101, partial [Zea mays]